MKKLKTSLLILMLNAVVYAQETILSAGNEAVGASGTVSYSIGQIVYTTNSASNGSSAQGVQQPFEIMTVVGIEIKDIQLELSTYPNPTTDVLILNVGNYAQENLSYQLTDLTGKLITSERVSSAQTQITMKELPIANYFLMVKKGDQLIKNFKIIKH